MLTRIANVKKILQTLAFLLLLITGVTLYADEADDPYDDNWVESASGYEEQSYYDESTDYDPYDDEENALQYAKNDVHSSRVGSASGSKGHRSYSSRLPQTLNGHGENVILINPRKHVWGAYASNGQLIRAGLATAGGSWCRDIKRSCRTRSGTFRIFSLGSRSCVSTRYPLGRGGAKMPYCMFFNGNQGLHGSYEVVEGNISHGCVRIGVSEARWLRFNFVNIGTKVIVLGY